MRSTVEFLGYLRTLNVSLSLDRETLKCSAPKGVLTAELRRELGQRKPEIVAFLRASKQAGQREQPVVSRIKQVDRSGPLPLSLAQQRLWFLSRLDSESTAYNIEVPPLRLIGALNVAALECSLVEIVRRHEDLRTSFVEVDGEPSAIIGDGKNWKLHRIDARGLDAAQLHHLATQQSKDSFDIAAGPLFRGALLESSENHHVLVLTMHHMISDGWSIGVLVKELEELYQSFSHGALPSLPPLAIQYVDFAAWQREWLESGEMDRQLGYWKKQLAAAPPVVGFPADHRRPLRETFRGRRAKLVFPRELTSAIGKLNKAHGVTLFMTLLAAFNVLMARYSGQDDIVVGSPSANRNRAELSPLIGFFVNNLVMRSDLSGNPSFSELLAKVREMTLRAYEHQDVPFDRLVQTLRPERSLDHSPLFQVMFILQNFPLEDLELPGLTIEPLELNVTTARFDLTVEISFRHGEMWAYFDYNSDIYDAGTIARIQRHYATILEAICANPDGRIGEIPLLSAAEQEQLVVDWNRTDAAIPEHCFHQQIAARVRVHPDRIAVVAGDEALSYRELEDRANRIATSLRSSGVARGALVAVYLERSVDLLAGIIAIAKCGAAYVPLDTAYPRARIVNIFEDAKPIAVLTSPNLRSVLPQTGAVVISVEGMRRTVVGADYASSTCSTGSIVESRDLAYVIFTSGSTGRPKGVEITHRSLVNFLESMQREPGFKEGDVLLAVTTVSFDIAVLELLLPLYAGGTVCIAQDPADSDLLLRDLARYRPTVVQATPATWKLLIAAGWKGDPDLKILCGGEALDPELARSLIDRSGALWNMYGPTETTIWSSALRIDGAGSAAIPIGRPIQNTSFFVLDELRQLVPLGVAGELWIGGEGVARGYLDRPELTDERFVSILFSDLAPMRLYRTGDLVRYRPDGTLDFLGRVDHQVKLRGFRIELGEIENALRMHAAVVDSVTLMREDGDNKRLVAYVIAGQGMKPSESDLRDHLRRVLPEYMVPTSFVFLSEIPRLPNGKLDRASLPGPDPAGYGGSREFMAPENALQENIAAAFRNVLHVEKVGLDDNFFELGAHSLQIVKVQADLYRSIEAKVPLIAFFQYPTIRALANFIEQQSGDEVRAIPDRNAAEFLAPLKRRSVEVTARDVRLQISAPAGVIDAEVREELPRRKAERMTFLESSAFAPAPLALLAEPRTTRIPQTQAQQGLWLLDHFGPGHIAYNISGAADVETTINRDALQQAVDGLLRRHESLRTSFYEEDGELLQKVSPEAVAIVGFTDLSKLPEAVRQKTLRSDIREQARMPFDLNCAPLIRFHLFRMAEDRHVIFFNIHHIVSDAYSLVILRHEITEMYRAALLREPPALPLLKLQFPDYAIWASKQLRSQSMNAQIKYWKSNLSDAPPVLNLPFTRSVGQRTDSGATLPVVIPADLCDRLKQIGREEGATPFITLLSAFAVLLYQQTREEDFCIGSPVTHRRHVETESLIGLFANMVVFRCDLRNSPSFRELLRRLRDTCLNAIENSDVSFQEVVRALQPDPRLQRSPLFQIMFLFEPYRAEEENGLIPIDTNPGTARFDLTLQLHCNANDITGSFEYCTDLFDEPSIAKLVRQFDVLLQQLANQPDARISFIAPPPTPRESIAPIAAAPQRKSSFWRFGRANPVN